MKPKCISAALTVCGLVMVFAPAALAQEQTQTSTSYKMVVEIGPPETMLMPDQARPGVDGEVMVQMPGMPMPDMSMTSQGNHHLETHIYNKTSGDVVMDVVPAISWQNQATGASGAISPVMAMYGNKEGKSDWHYGGNVTLADGTYTVTVKVGGDQAVFKDLAVSGAVAAPAQAPKSMPGMSSSMPAALPKTGAGGGSPELTFGWWLVAGAIALVSAAVGLGTLFHLSCSEKVAT